MIDGDYKIVTKGANQYTMINDRYILLELIGGGGFRDVYKVMDLDTKEEKALNIIKFSGEQYRTPLKRLEKNLKKVKECQDNHNGMIGGTGKLIRLHEIFKLPKSNLLSFVTDFEDMHDKFSLRDVHKGTVVLDGVEKCKIAIDIASFFKGIHRAGFIYKDINEGNLFFSKNGDLVVADVENILYDIDSMVIGTPGYIAPELYMDGRRPSFESDRFSVAVFLYRLMIGNHFPYEGKSSVSIRLDPANDSVDSRVLMEKIYGKEAVFAFDPKNQTNELREINIPYNETKQNIYKECVDTWDSMPEIIQNAFITSFVDGKTDSNKRIRDGDWIELFEYILEEGIVKCPHCKARNINGGPGSIKCCSCHKAFDSKKGLEKKSLSSLLFKPS